MVLVIAANQVYRAWVVNQVGKWLETEVAFANDCRLLYVGERIVVGCQTINISFELIHVEQVAHHNQSVFELRPVPYILLLRLKVVHLDFDIVLLLTDVKAGHVRVQG